MGNLTEIDETQATEEGARAQETQITFTLLTHVKVPGSLTQCFLYI